MAQLLDRVSSPAPSPLPNLLIPATGMATLPPGPFFPLIAAVGINAVLVAIITHDFKAADLHKLDPTNWDQETAYTFNGATNQFETYFHILTFHMNDAAATEIFWAYTEQLLELVAEYK
ncbi:hypothetical protein J132_08179 [Termitomyces sp. J132]|nr:hypothetical protein J132_08179 [Termitomyces sp. J132]